MLVTIPNVFTPNDDGVNEKIKIAMYGITSQAFAIARNNVEVFSTSTLNNAWDGYFQEKLQEEGIYSYSGTFITIHQDTLRVSGTFSLASPETISSEEFVTCEHCIYPDMIDDRRGVIYQTREPAYCR